MTTKVEIETNFSIEWEAAGFELESYNNQTWDRDSTIHHFPINGQKVTISGSRVVEETLSPMTETYQENITFICIPDRGTEEREQIIKKKCELLGAGF